MAAKVFYLLATTGTAPYWWGSIQDSGSAPAAVLAAFGGTPDIQPLTSPYIYLGIGATLAAQMVSIASFISGRTAPKTGTSATSASSAGDSFATSLPYHGSFAAGNWALSFGMRSTGGTGTGRINVRIWASVNPNGSSPRELTSGLTACTAVGMPAINTTYASLLNWNAPAITLNNEYLFFQVEWQETVLGTNGFVVKFYQSACTITTTNYTPIYTELSSADFAPAVGLAGDLALTLPLAGNIPVTVPFTGDLSADMGLVGDLAPSVTLGGDIYVQLHGDVDGRMDVIVDFAGEMLADIVVAGDMSALVTFAGTLTDLWEPDSMPVDGWLPSAPVPSSVWVASQPCPGDWEDSELCSG